MDTLIKTFSNNPSIPGGMLALAILAIVGLYKDHKTQDKEIGDLEQKRVDDEKDVVEHVVLKMDSIDNQMKAILVTIESLAKK